MVDKLIEGQEVIGEWATATSEEHQAINKGDSLVAVAYLRGK